jgi:hypothetical protein
LPPTHAQRSATSSASASASPRSHSGAVLLAASTCGAPGANSANPFHSPPHDSNSTSPAASTSTSAPVSPFASNASYATSSKRAHTTTSGNYTYSRGGQAPRTAPPAHEAFALADVRAPPPPALPCLPSASSPTAFFDVISPSPSNSAQIGASTAQVAVQNGNAEAPQRAYPVSANPRVAAFSTSTSTSKDEAEKPPLHQHCQGTSGGDVYGETSPQSQSHSYDLNLNSKMESTSTRYGNASGSEGYARTRSPLPVSRRPPRRSLPTSPTRPLALELEMEMEVASGMEGKTPHPP